MKKLTIILSVMLISATTFAQSTIFFQAVAKDNSNNLAVNTTIFIQTSILESATSTTSLLTEQFTATTDSYGMFGIGIGGGTRIGGTATNIQSIDWSVPNRHLNIKVSFATSMPSVNDPSWVNMGTSAFGVVPYALYSGASGGSLGTQDLLDSVKAKLNASDTSSLSNRINLKVNISDTASMLSKYYNKTATDGKLSLKLNISDTSNMLSKYYNKTVTDAKLALKLNSADTANLSNRINLKLNSSDTASLSNRINLKLSKTDTSTLSNRINLKLNISDTSAMLSNRIARDTLSLSSRINAISTNVGTRHTLGESFGGGIIIYLESDNQHGIIAATQDGYNQNAQALPWTSGSLNYLGARKDGLYAGRTNTERIISAQTTGITSTAASFIGNLVINNYGDWYLPSKAELQKVIDYSKANPSVLPMNGGLYWSSTEVDGNNAYALSLTTQASGSYKTNSHIVRAIRTF